MDYTDVFRHNSDRCYYTRLSPKMNEIITVLPKKAEHYFFVPDTVKTQNFTILTARSNSAKIKHVGTFHTQHHDDMNIM